MEQRVVSLFADVLQVDSEEIHDDVSPDSLETWDSLNHLNLIATFEEEFGLDIDPEEMPDMMKNFEAFKTVILTKLG